MNKLKLTNYGVVFSFSPLEGEEEESSVLKEGKGLDPFMIQPSAKNETPARIAVPQA